MIYRARSARHRRTQCEPIRGIRSSRFLCVRRDVLDGWRFGRRGRRKPELPAEWSGTQTPGGRHRRSVRLPREHLDLEDPAENKRLYRLANKLHVRTQPHMIREQLLFKSGDRLSQRLIDESARILRSARYFYDASVDRSPSKMGASMSRSRRAMSGH